MQQLQFVEIVALSLAKHYCKKNKFREKTIR